jgi:hypothetical protein
MATFLCILESLPYKRGHHGFWNNEKEDPLCGYSWSKGFKLGNLESETRLESCQSLMLIMGS